MKVAIHHREGSFSERWIQFCRDNNLEFKIVNCYSTNIIREVKDCDLVLWHYHHNDYRDMLFAKELLFALEQSGKIVFPNFKTGWSFDDKLGQKFLLQSLGLPLISTYSFYEKKPALDWIKDTSFPKVFKLRGGAGSANVQIVRTKKHARRLVRTAFNKGFPVFKGKTYFIDRLKKYNSGVITLSQMLKSSLRLFIKRKSSRMFTPEKGYVYFQDFFPNQEGDIRIIVIGDKAFGIKRLVLKNDFRASGSGKILYDRKFFSKETLSLAFEVSKRLDSQCCAIDFIYRDSKPFIVEVSYGFTQGVYENCQGFWDKDLNWVEGPFNPQEWIINNLIKQHDCKTVA